MLMRADKSCLLVVDVQEKLIGAIHEGRRVIDGCAWLMRVAQHMNVPVLVTEQYPKGLGHTVEELRTLVPPAAVADKVHFSCAASPNCLSAIDRLNRSQIVIAGVESHVCVLQTALDLLDADKDVYLVADAVGSRNPSDREFAIERMRAEGVRIVTREMVAFEWAHQAGTPQFRELSAKFLR